MKVAFSCYNIYTLYVSYVYTLYLKREYQCKVSIIWRNSILEFPSSSLKEQWDRVVEIDIKKHCDKNQYISKFAIKKEVYLTAKQSKVLKDIDALFVFKDNYIVDALMLEMVRSKKEVKTVLIEEGIGIYSVNQYQGFLLEQKLKRVIYSLLYRTLRLPLSLLKAQGFSGMLDAMIVRSPEKVHSLAEKKNIYKQSEMLFVKYVACFASLIDQGYKAFIEDVDYIYVGQPLSEDGIVSMIDEIDLLVSVIESIGQMKVFVIKIHQREKREKYFGIINDYPNVCFLDDVLMGFPAELVCCLLHYPKLITPLSSTAFNMVKSGFYDKVYLLYEMIALSDKGRKSLDGIFAGASFIKVKKGDLNSSKIWDDYKAVSVVQKHERIKNTYSEMDSVISMIR